MDGFVRQKLYEIIEIYGKSIYYEDKKLEGLLKDFCGEYKKEINLIMLAVRSKIALEMLDFNSNGHIEIILPQLTKRLADDYSINQNSAKWVIDSVSISLKLIKMDDLKINESIKSVKNIVVSVLEETKNELPDNKLNHDLIIDFDDSIILEMTKIPAGIFEMGSRDSELNRDLDEGPIHVVNITQEFYLSKYQITQGLWVKLMKKNPSKFHNYKNYPVNNVSWNDCQEFIGRLNELNLTTGFFKLPTEAEWEYACRAGTKTPYYWGDNMSGNFCWYDGNSEHIPHPVGQKKPNAFGLYDMSGNLMDWCNDWYDENYYKTSPINDPAGPINGTYRVLRGGSWNLLSNECRSANRDHASPSSKGSYTGLRLALYFFGSSPKKLLGI